MTQLIDSWAQPSKESMISFRKEQIAQKQKQKNFWTLILYSKDLERERILSLIFSKISKMMMEVGTYIL